MQWTFKKIEYWWRNVYHKMGNFSSIMSRLLVPLYTVLSVTSLNTLVHRSFCLFWWMIIWGGILQPQNIWGVSWISLILNQPVCTPEKNLTWCGALWTYSEYWLLRLTSKWPLNSRSPIILTPIYACHQGTIGRICVWWAPHTEPTFSLRTIYTWWYFPHLVILF